MSCLNPDRSSKTSRHSPSSKAILTTYRVLSMRECCSVSPPSAASNLVKHGQEVKIHILSETPACVSPPPQPPQPPTVNPCVSSDDLQLLHRLHVTALGLTRTAREILPETRHVSQLSTLQLSRNNGSCHSTLYHRCRYVLRARYRPINGHCPPRFEAASCIICKQ